MFARRLVRGLSNNPSPTLLSKIIRARDLRSKSRKSRDLDALGAREVMVVIKVGIVVTVAVGVSE